MGFVSGTCQIGTTQAAERKETSGQVLKSNKQINKTNSQPAPGVLVSLRFFWLKPEIQRVISAVTNKSGMPIIPVKIRNSSAGVGRLVAVAVGTLKLGDIRIHKNANTLTVNSGDGSVINSGVPLQQNGAVWMSNMDSNDMKAGALPVDQTDAQGLIQQLDPVRPSGMPTRYETHYLTHGKNDPRSIWDCSTYLNAEGYKDPKRELGRDCNAAVKDYIQHGRNETWRKSHC